MKRIVRVFVRTFVVVATGLAATPAVADERSERSAALRGEGNRRMDQRQFDEALARYQEALALTPSDAAIYYPPDADLR